MQAGGNVRSRARIEHHYNVERELARRIKNSDRGARKELYTAVYDELFKRVDDHPQIQAKVDVKKRQRRIKWQISLLQRIARQKCDFLEIGPGDCALSIAMCDQAKTVTAVDVSNEITRRADLPSNFSLIISDGTSIACSDKSIDLAYSDQLMEHLHPEDAHEQLREVFRVLRPGGKYLVITPNSSVGPHDITKFFNEETIPQGLHLKEYNFGELDDILKQVGFHRTFALVGAVGVYLRIPITWAVRLESIFMALPVRVRRICIRNVIARPLLNLILGARVVAEKPTEQLVAAR